MGIQSDEGDRCAPDADSWGWFKGERGVSALAAGEGQRARVEDAAPSPTMRTQYWARSGSGIQFHLSRCCPGRFSQPLWEGEGETTCFPPTSSKQEDEDGVNPHCLSCYLLFPLPLVYLLLGTPAGIGPDGASFV